MATEGHKPPAGVQAAGKRALQLIKDGRAGGNFTGVGRARAAQLARGDALSEATIRRMNSYFSRHVNDKKPDWGKAGKETPGYVAWQAWGGDAGKSWAAKMVRSFDAGTKSELSADQVESLLDAMDGLTDALTGQIKSRPLTTVNFDGTECVTVDQLAATNRCSVLKAAVWASQRDVGGLLGKSAHQYLKDLQRSSDDHTGSVCIMLVPDVRAKTQMAIEGGEPAGELHCTLYFGGGGESATDQVSDQTVAWCYWAAQRIASNHGPVPASANGITRFSGKDKDALVVSLDSPALPRIYAELLKLMDETPDVQRRAPDHGFTPHITLGYLAHESMNPIDRWLPMDIKLPTIEVWEGGSHAAYPLGQELPMVQTWDEFWEKWQERDNERTEKMDEEPAIVPIAEQFANVVIDTMQGKDVHSSNGGRRKTRKRKIIQRARGMMTNPVTEEKS